MRRPGAGWCSAVLATLPLFIGAGRGPPAGGRAPCRTRSLASFSCTRSTNCSWARSSCSSPRCGGMAGGPARPMRCGGDRRRALPVSARAGHTRAWWRIPRPDADRRSAGRAGLPALVPGRILSRAVGRRADRRRMETLPRRTRGPRHDTGGRRCDPARTGRASGTHHARPRHSRVGGRGPGRHLRPGGEHLLPRAAEAAAIGAVAAILTLFIAAPVVRAPSERVFGMEIVGRHHDPFTVMRQFDGPIAAGVYSQPITDIPGALLARVFGPVAAYNWLVLLTFPLSAIAAFLLARYLACRRPAPPWPRSPTPLLPFTWRRRPIIRTSRRHSGYPCTCSRSGAASTRRPRRQCCFLAPPRRPSRSRTSTAG